LYGKQIWQAIKENDEWLFCVLFANSSGQEMRISWLLNLAAENKCSVVWLKNLAYLGVDAHKRVKRDEQEMSVSDHIKRLRVADYSDLEPIMNVTSRVNRLAQFISGNHVQGPRDEDQPYLAIPLEIGLMIAEYRFGARKTEAK